MNLLFIIFSLFDYLLTVRLISKYGTEAEANPIAIFVYEKTGFIGLLLFKIVIVLTVLSIIWALEKRSPNYALFIKLFSCFFTGIAVLFGMLA